MRFVRTVFFVALVSLIVVPAAFALRFTDDSYNMPTGYVGQPYSKQFDGAGGCGPALPYQYSILSGNLPPGLSLSFRGLISGTPAAAGSYSFWVNLSDQDPPSADWCRPSNAQRQFTITVLSSGGSPGPITPPTAPPSAPLTVTSTGAPDGEVDLTYGLALTASGGGSSKTWSVASGQLPPGLTLTGDGHIAGKPTSPGRYDFTVAVADGKSSASKTLTINVAPGITVAASPLAPTVEVRTPFTASVATVVGLSGGTPPYRYAPVSGFPFGVGFDSNAGTIFGSPRQAGTLTLTISITDAKTVTKQVMIPVVVLPRLHIVPIDLHRGHVAKAYRARITVTGGKAPAWIVSAGKLPAGLKLDPTTGMLIGVPRARGAFPFTVSVHDSLGATVAIRYTLVIGR